MLLRQYWQALLAFTVGLLVPPFYINLQRTALAKSGPAVITLHPQLSFLVPAVGETKVVDVTTTGTDLWFLLHSKNGFQAIKMNSSGDVQIRVDLGPTITRINSIFAAADGRLGIMSRDHVDIYSSSGSMFQTSEIENSLGCVFLDRGLFSVTPNRLVQVPSSPASQIYTPGAPFRWPTAVFSMPQDRIGVIELGPAILHQLDVQTGAWNTSRLTAPEIQDVSRVTPTDRSVSPPIFSVSIDNSSGDLLTAVGPFNVNEGAIILRFKSDGGLLSRFRCSLPKSPALKTQRNQDGHFVLNKIAVLQDKLVLISYSQRTCLLYDIH